MYRHFDCLDRRESTVGSSQGPLLARSVHDRCVRSVSKLPCLPCTPCTPVCRNVTSGFGWCSIPMHTPVMIAFTHAFHAPRRDIWRIWRFRGRRYVGGSGTKGRRDRVGGGEGRRRVREGIGNGAEVMSIIGFNIGALGKPVYKYPYGTVITT